MNGITEITTIILQLIAIAGSLGLVYFFCDLIEKLLTTTVGTVNLFKSLRKPPLTPKGAPVAHSSLKSK